MAPGLRLPRLRPRWRLAPERWAVHVSHVLHAQFGDGRNDLRPDEDAADGVVDRLLAVCHRQGRDLGVEFEAGLEIGSYQTAWTMLHRLRSVLVRPGRDLLSGTVQVQETYLGAAKARLTLGATIPTSCCEPCIGWPRW